MKNVTVSVIIPTYNEGLYIGKLLGSLKGQTSKDFEAIVADWNSADNTIDIASSYGVRILRAKRRGVAAGRNEGAKAAKGPLLLFLDADTVVPPDFIESVERLFSDNSTVGMTCRFTCIDSKITYKLLYKMADVLLLLSWGLNIFPYHVGFCCAFRKDAFFRAGRFREDMAHSEDVDFSRRISAVGEVQLMNKMILTSARRLEKEGSLMLCARYVRNAIGMIMFKRAIGGYSYGIFTSGSGKAGM